MEYEVFSLGALELDHISVSTRSSGLELDRQTQVLLSPANIHESINKQIINEQVHVNPTT